MSAEREDESISDRLTGTRLTHRERRTSNTSLASTAGASSYDSLANEREDPFQTSPRASNDLDLRRVMSGSSVAGHEHTRSQSFSDLTRTHSINDSSRASNTRRRDKAAVGFACLNCKKAHLACDVARPCRRCVQMGRSATCTDVPHKRRGRPRLRDTQQLSSISATGSTSSLQLSSMPSSPMSIGSRPGHSGSSSLATPYQDFSSPAMSSGVWSTNQGRRHLVASNPSGLLGGVARSPTSTTTSGSLPSWPAPTSEPFRPSSATLLVSTDLTIVRALQDVQGFFCANPSVIEGRNLTELCHANEKSKMPQLIQALQSDTRAHKLLFGAQHHRQSLHADLQPYTNHDLSHPFPGSQEHLMTMTFIDALNRQIPARMVAVIGSRSNDRFAYAIVSIQRQDQSSSPIMTRPLVPPPSPRSYEPGVFQRAEFHGRQPPSVVPLQSSPTFKIRHSPNTYPNAATLPRPLATMTERASTITSLPHQRSPHILPPLQNIGDEQDLARAGTATPTNATQAVDDTPRTQARSRHSDVPRSPKRTSMSLSEMIG